MKVLMKSYYKIKYILNTDDLEGILKKILKKFQIPDIFVNCSYPRTKNGKIILLIKLI